MSTYPGYILDELHYFIYEKEILLILSLFKVFCINDLTIDFSIVLCLIKTKIIE
jgi:hypothetical protein